MRKYTKVPTKAKAKMTKEERRAKYTKIARDRSQKQRQRLEQRNLTCFHCRQRGHGVENCPEKDNHNKSKCCYKCGSTEHSLHMCPKKHTVEGLPFATCFICKEQGHLASKCPTNEKGIYVNGGCCKNCGGNDHLSKDCPQKKAPKEKNDKFKGVPELENYDDLVEPTHTQSTDKPKKESEQKTPQKRRVVNF